MAKGSPKNYDKHIADIDLKIEKALLNVTNLKTQHKELLAQKQASLLNRVTVAAAEKGVSVEELLTSALG